MLWGAADADSVDAAASVSRLVDRPKKKTTRVVYQCGLG
jgi:hypothetical protein